MWDVIGIRELRRREECFTTLQIGHVLHHPKAKNGRAGVGFQKKSKWKTIIYGEGKQHQPQSSKTCSLHGKALQTKDTASVCTDNIILRRKYKWLLQRRRWNFREPNPLYNSGERFQCANREKNKPTETTTGKVGYEFLNERGDTKKVQNHECHVSEEIKKEMDVEKSKPCSEDRNWLHSKKKVKHRHRRNSEQPIQHCMWPQNGKEPHEAGPRARIK